MAADPLSVAASVAGLVALTGSISKSFYQLFHSIHDAPSSVRALATGLFSLNIALAQVQEVLLNPDFVHQSQDQEAEALGDCLTRCASLLTAIERRVQKSGLGDGDLKGLKKAWQSVKWSFNEDDLDKYHREIEEEKSNLTVILHSFTAYVLHLLHIHNR